MTYNDILLSALQIIEDRKIKEAESLLLRDEERSCGFNKRIDEIEQSIGKGGRLGAKKIIALILAAAISALTITACAYGEQIVRAVKKIIFNEMDGYSEAYLDNNKDELIYYEPTWVPSGYELTSRTLSYNVLLLSWKSDVGQIEYQQILKGYVFIDNDSVYQEITLSNNSVIRYTMKQGTHFAYWEMDAYICVIAATDDVCPDELFNIILSTKKALYS